MIDEDTLKDWLEISKNRINFLENPFGVSSRSIVTMKPQESDSRICLLIEALREARSVMITFGLAADEYYEDCKILEAQLQRAKELLKKKDDLMKAVVLAKKLNRDSIVTSPEAHIQILEDAIALKLEEDSE